PGAAGTAGVVVARTGHHLAVPGFGGILRVFGLAVHRRAVGRGLAAGGGALALALVLAFAFFAALLLIALGLVIDIAEIKIEILQQPASGSGIGVLIEDRAVELAEIIADPAPEPWTPQIDDASCGGRRPVLGQDPAGRRA